MNPARGGWVILLSIATAMLFSVAYLPDGAPYWLGWLRPNWLVLFVFYWVMAVPHRLGLISAWLIGLLVDVLHGELLGLNAVTLASLTYVTWLLHERLRMYTTAQQAMVVLVLALGAELIRMAMNMLAGNVNVSAFVIVPALMTALCWPPVYLTLRWVRRHLGVA